jgi:hypothetical protein
MADQTTFKPPGAMMLEGMALYGAPVWRPLVRRLDEAVITVTQEPAESGFVIRATMKLPRMAAVRVPADDR